MAPNPARLYSDRMALLTKSLAFVLLLGGLIFFHELGHFLAAKLFRVKVLKFSVGFGPRLVGFTRGETTYQLSALPLGGYVRMAGEVPGDVLDDADRGRGFSDQAPWKRAVIAFAGPFVNLVLPVAVYAAIHFTPHAAPAPVLGLVLPEGAAAQAGLVEGDRLTRIDGQEVRSFDDLRDLVAKRPGERLSVGYLRGGEARRTELVPEPYEEVTPLETRRVGRIGVAGGRYPAIVGVRTGSPACDAGLRMFDRVETVDGRPVASRIDLQQMLGDGRPHAVHVSRPNTIGGDVAATQTLDFAVSQGTDGLFFPSAALWNVTPDSGAARAGLRPGDLVTAIDGKAVTSAGALFDALENRSKAAFTVERDGQPLTLEVAADTKRVPDRIEGGQRDVYVFGLEFHPGLYRSTASGPEETVRVSEGLVASLRRALQDTYDVTRSMVLGIAAMVTGRVSTRSIGGPIMMFQLAGAATERGLADFLEMLALLSVNLGLMNLLPVPVLDGFHIVVAAVEGVTRREVPLRLRAIANGVGLVLLLCLMLLAFKNDLARTFAS
ncbi:MAG: hypothetical protein RL199_1174 [Pseudomonadota bacterium]|jgi:regulator of sigma E protease